VLGQLPGVKCLDGTFTGAATSSRFHGIPLTKKSGLDGFQYIDHFKRGQCSFCTFVTGFGASTFDGLFNTFGSQYGERDRNFSILCNVRQTIACTARNVFEVRSAATNNSTQCNHRVVFTGFRQRARCQWQFVSTWYPNDGNVVIFNLADTFQGVNRTFQQAVVDEVVETRNADGDASVRGSYSIFNNVHTFPLRVHLAPLGGGFYHNTSRTASLFQEQ